MLVLSLTSFKGNQLHKIAIMKILLNGMVMSLSTEVLYDKVDFYIHKNVELCIWKSNV